MAPRGGGGGEAQEITSPLRRQPSWHARQCVSCDFFSGRNYQFGDSLPTLVHHHRLHLIPGRRGKGQGCRRPELASLSWATALEEGILPVIGLVQSSPSRPPAYTLNLAAVPSSFWPSDCPPTSLSPHLTAQKQSIGAWPSAGRAGSSSTSRMLLSSRLLRTTLLALVALVLLLSLSPSALRFGDYLRQTNPFSGQKAVEQSFVPTASELACLNGTPLPDHSPGPDPDPIPNIVHFIFLQKLPLRRPGQVDFDFLCYLAVRSAIVSLKPDRLFLHYSYLPSLSGEGRQDEARHDPLALDNPWIRRLKGHLTLRRHDAPVHSAASTAHPAHLADTMRLQILAEHGGIYLDLDAFALRPFTSLLRPPPRHDIVMGNEGGNRAGLCNAVMAARANSSFVARWLDRYRGADLGKEWNYHSVLLPKELALEHADSICQLPPDAFFWPTWTWRHIQWMHEPISTMEARFWEERIRRTGGSLFDNQLAYHAWSQMAKDRFMKRLTPEIVRSEDTRFNLLVRRFLGPGLDGG